jgi:hypothetical protein
MHEQFAVIDWLDEPGSRGLMSYFGHYPEIACPAIQQRHKIQGLTSSVFSYMEEFAKTRRAGSASAESFQEC